MKRTILSASMAILFGSFACADEPERVLIPALHSDGITLSGYFLGAATATGKAPAVVLMHGCGGPVTASGRIRARERSWMERLSAAGYASLLVDSFNPRGVRSTCGAPTPGLSSIHDRPLDAYAGLRWLKARAEIDGAKVALMGWSHGAETVLSAVSRNMADRIGRPSDIFVTAVAFYPGCRRLQSEPYRVTTPLLLHLGQADDWTPMKFCEGLTRPAVNAGDDVRTFVYPGAHHGFDQPAGQVRERRLPSGRVVSSGPHPVARELAITRTMEALYGPLGQRRTPESPR